MSELDRIDNACLGSTSHAHDYPEANVGINRSHAPFAADQGGRHRERTTAFDRYGTTILQDRVLPHAPAHEATPTTRAHFPRTHGLGSINFHLTHLRRGDAMTRTLANDECLTVIYGEGGGCTFNAYGDVQAILIPLHGFLQITVSDFATTLRAGEAFVTEYATHLKAVGHMRAQWLELLGGAHAWERMLRNIGVCPAWGTQFLPARHSANNELRRHAVALVRAWELTVLESTVNAVIDNIVTLQAPLFDTITRCPGRTYAKKLDSFLRLQRVRNFISTSCDQEIHNEVLAHMANYSPAHFIRVFNAVFQETPHTYLVEQRLCRADRLLRSGELSVSEVGYASGFENRSAFSRSFRHRFGTTANETRHKAEKAGCAGYVHAM